MLKEWKSGASFLSFLVLLTTFILLSQFATPALAATSSASAPLRSSRINRQNEQMKKRLLVSSVSSSPRREWRTLAALNSSRNARQVPDIPALYSAPKIPTPEIPALYSAPKINSDSSDTQNEVDSTADPQSNKVTTEITIGEDEEEDETSSEDYQYGVPTEKYPMGDNPNQAEEESPNEHPTDSPLPQATYLPPVSRTNDVDFDDNNNNDETTEDSYGGYNNDAGNAPNPSQQYGPPVNNRKNGNGANKQKMESSPSSRNNNNNNGRPSGQQREIDNSVQSMTHPQKNGGNNPGYLPPVYQPPSIPINHDDRQQKPKDKQQESQRQPAHIPSSYEQQPPNPNYHTLPEPEHAPQQNDFRTSQYEPNLVDNSGTGDNTHSPQDLSPGRSYGVPKNKGQQGEYFGNNQPNSFYGPPGVNHVRSQSVHGEEEELEGLNEKIVDAELLQRVQQIIEDHEKQQKVLLDKIQKDNEKALDGSSGYPGASRVSSYSGNELNSKDGPASSDLTSPDFSSPRGGSSFYGPPTLSNALSNSNEYPNPNSAQQQQQNHGYTQKGNNQNQPGGAYSPASSLSKTQNGRDYNNNFNQRQSPEPGKTPQDVQVQKAVLSRHFTETEPDSTYKSGDGGYPQQNQLNSVAGPGQQYLPPASPSSGQQQFKNSQNVGYPNGIEPGNEKPEDHQNGYSANVGFEIAVDGGTKSTSGSTSPQPSYSKYGPPAFAQQNTPLSSLSSSTTSQDSGEFHSRQGGGSSSTSVLERFPSQISYLPPLQQQQPNFQPSAFWSRTNQQTPSLGPKQTRYGPPLPENINEKPTTFQSAQTSTANNNDRSGVANGGEHSYQSKQSNGAADDNDDYHQRSYNSEPSQNQHSVPQPRFNTNDNPVVPRPLYGVPLAPVITLDSNNHLNNFNNNGNNNNNVGGGTQEGFNSPSYSPDVNKVDQSFPVGTSESTNNYYLPPPSSSFRQYSTTGLPSSLSPSHDAGISQHQFSLPSIFPQQELQAGTTPNDDAASYGLLANNPSSSSSSAYLMIQGHNGNSNNHIYKINHNGYDTSSSSSSHIFTPLSSPSGSRDDGSSIIIPGISNAFTLPIYDYSPSHHNDEPAGAATVVTTPVVVPFEQFLGQLPANTQVDSSPLSTFPDNVSSTFYGTRRQDNFRVTRRALSKKAIVDPTSDNRNRKQLSTFSSTASNVNKNVNRRRS